MAQKRPFDDEEVNEVSSKHQKQDGPGAEIISHNVGFSKQANVVKFHNLGETSTQKAEVGSRPEIPWEGVQETECDAPRSTSLPHWATSSASDEDEPSEEMFHLPLYSECFSFDHPVRSAFDPGEGYHCSSVFPRKRVSVGPEHQAEIPHWDENASNGKSGDMNLSGTCIMPILETQYLAHCVLKAGDGRIDCRCPDRGSIRCVRLHIAEAREKLSRVLGYDTLMELGFNNMGEVVANKWTNEEEHLFHEIVYSNPVSMGKNFWVALSAVFPSRTTMEIVSYYFNVFMLRKRAEQNRCDPMNVDSDNDEWQASDNDAGDEGEVSDEDDDSGIESPVRHDGLLLQQNGLLAQEHEEDDGDVSDDAQETDENNGQRFICKSDSDSVFQYSVKKSDDGSENEVQDGSCTSSDSGASAQGAHTLNDGCHDWHEYILDSTDAAKAWDGYMNCPKSNAVDFLPTCSMIEEIFGGDFDFKDNKRW